MSEPAVPLVLSRITIATIKFNSRVKLTCLTTDLKVCKKQDTFRSGNVVMLTSSFFLLFFKGQDTLNPMLAFWSDVSTKNALAKMSHVPCCEQ